jgi:iduronate 2-sulfatase
MRAPYLLLIIFTSVATFAQDRPNVLFIAIDDLVPTLGVYGDPYAKTPEIDTLASRGTTFLNHHVQWSVCGPSRAALTTSLMPEETGVIGFRAIRGVLPNVVTLPQYFKQNGYETACSGKFHDNRTVGDATKKKSSKGQFPNGRGIDDPASWSIPFNNGGGSGYRPKGHNAVDYANADATEFVDYDVLKKGEALLDQIAGGDKPFFLAVGFKKPHLAFIAPTPYWDHYDSNGNGQYDDDFPLPDFAQAPKNASQQMVEVLANSSELQSYMPYKQSGMPTEAQVRELRHGYYACVSFVDSLVGQLLEKLAATPDPVQTGKMMDETTIIVLWGDHGFYLGEHDRWAKHSITERTTAAPLIIVDPRNSVTGTKTMSPANTIDLYPTLCELAGLPLPEQPTSADIDGGRPLRGSSLVPLLKDPQASVHAGAVSHFNSKGYSAYAYRTERYRYIEWIRKGVVEEIDLFDLQAQGLESVDIAEVPESAPLIEQLSLALRADPASQGMTALQQSRR